MAAKVARLQPGLTIGWQGTMRDATLHKVPISATARDRTLEMANRNFNRLLGLD